MSWLQNYLLAGIITEISGLHAKLNTIMASQAELAADLRAVATQQQKTIDEIGVLQGTVTGLNAEVDRLNALIAAGGPITDELANAGAEVKRLAQLADDQIPDVTPVTPPAPEA